LQTLAAGTDLSLAEFSRWMISISDNTAADHLIHHLGRKTVEAEVKRYAPSHYRLDVPFLTTHDLFALKLSAAKKQRDQYLSASPEKKRKMLDDQFDSMSLPAGGDIHWEKPRQIDRLEWFASPMDMCRVLSALKSASQTKRGEPVGLILSVNPGIHFSRKDWPYVGFKGGSEPGVLTFNWLLRRADGHWFVVVVDVANPKEAFGQSKPLAVAESAAMLLAKYDDSPNSKP